VVLGVFLSLAGSIARRYSQTRTASCGSSYEHVALAVGLFLGRDAQNILPREGLLTGKRPNDNCLIAEPLKLGRIRLPVVQYDSHLVACRQVLEIVPLAFGLRIRTTEWRRRSKA